MPAEKVLHIRRHKAPLVLRARFAWTFFGLGLFAAVNLFLVGSYLLSVAIRDPLEASPVDIVGAGFMLALASFLVVYLVSPRIKAAFAKPADFAQQHRTFAGPVLTVCGEALRSQIEAEHALTLAKQIPTHCEPAPLRRVLAPADSAPPGEYGDAARARR